MKKLIEKTNSLDEQIAELFHIIDTKLAVVESKVGTFPQATSITGTRLN